MRFRFTMLILVMASARAASAQLWDETTDGGGDAGHLPATVQVCIGVGSLTDISGTLDPTADVDAFLIRIAEPADFFASTVGGAAYDTQLFLFTASGAGVTANDDHVGGTTLQSRITGQFVPDAGIYILAISRYNSDPQNAAGLLIWNNTPFRSEREPDGPGATAGDPVLASWTGAAAGTAGPYRITLSGCEFADDGCTADYDGDGFVTGLDFDSFVADFEAGDPAADFDGNGFVNGLDFDAYVVVFEAGC